MPRPIDVGALERQLRSFASSGTTLIHGITPEVPVLLAEDMTLLLLRLVGKLLLVTVVPLVFFTGAKLFTVGILDFVLSSHAKWVLRLLIAIIKMHHKVIQ
ncbi:hypothetical protein NADFUDRAFT_84279 [Nadsonia fulvescens var. elongata DSM 6958]|uniref:Uncharacterized protein n=1 Tax=Nadsonia fulvescens var. elongata DSM 6958 TaxID=857566 RepID=A0A1E3PE07_9ASCO|nr:hypothetical protein NADFUDRAFT_84279 [Nadsonia fulvescens var. elongata DSM 6958]